MTDDDNESDRTPVRTYITEHQKGIWDEEADSMDMSRSEFVRCMVQAGRRDFDLSEGNDEKPVDDGGGVRDVDYVLDEFRDEPARSFDQLLERGEVELGNRLDALMEAGVIRYRPRRDVFVILDEE